jgi:hypothetical protein
MRSPYHDRALRSPRVGKAPLDAPGGGGCPTGLGGTTIETMASYLGASLVGSVIAHPAAKAAGSTIGRIHLAVPLLDLMEDLSSNGVEPVSTAFRPDGS